MLYPTLKRSAITLPDGRPALVSTVQLSPSLYETMVLDADGADVAAVRDLSAAAAIASHNHLVDVYGRPDVSALPARYRQLSAGALRCAASNCQLPTDY